MAWRPKVTTDARGPFLQVAKTVVAIVIAWFASVLVLDVEIPAFAAIAAILVVAPSVHQSLAKGIERSVGVIVGVLIAFGAGLLLGESSLVVLAIVAIAVVIAWLLRLAPMASNQVAISAMLMLSMGGLGDPGFALDRIVETVIGAVVALAVNFAIVPPLAHERAERQLRDFANAIAAVFDRIAAELRLPPASAETESSPAAVDGMSLLEQSRRLRDHAAASRLVMDELADSLTLNPRLGKHRDRIARDERLLRILQVLSNRAIGMARTVQERHIADLADDPLIARIAEELTRISHDVRLLVQMHEHEDASTTSLPQLEPQALTRPIAVPAPHPTQWVLIGSLIEDVRQVRASLQSGFADDGV